MGEQNTQNPYESVSMKIGEDAVPVCPNCLEPCDPLDYYCPYCDSNEAINPLASYMPYVRIRFHAGNVWKALAKKLVFGDIAKVTLVLFFDCLSLSACNFYNWLAFCNPGKKTKTIQRKTAISS